MIYFHNDYSEGCHPKLLEALTATNLLQTVGYGEDEYCASAAAKIRKLCENDNLAVHFLVGGTQTNLTVIAATLRPHQGVLCAGTGHINVHETGAIEATGHKVLPLASDDGKITAQQVRDYVNAHFADHSFEHTVQPGMVYISHPTELGTLYSRQELTALSDTCRELGLPLFLDGARLGYGLTACDSDLDFPTLAKLCDVFYIGGTKVGALFGEAVVISHPAIRKDFRYLIKQNGGMLAKGRLLGVQFDALFTDNLYLEISRQADRFADQIRATLAELKVELLVPGTSNQIFPILSDKALELLGKDICFTEMHRVNDTHRAIRFCTSWATTAENTDILCEKLRLAVAEAQA